MKLAAAALLVPTTRPFLVDGFGERWIVAGSDGPPLEILRLDATFLPFEAAIRERVAVLAAFDDPSFARVQSVETDPSSGQLLLVSDHVPGVRLSALLGAAEPSHAPSLTVVRALIRQLSAAVAAWRAELPGLSHGALSAERVVITPEGRLVIVESVLGAAIEQLPWSKERFWNDLRIAVPGAGPAAIDARADVAQLGTIALAIALGRPLSAADQGEGADDALDYATVRTERGDYRPLPAALRRWLLRTLQRAPHHPPFASALDAHAAIDALGPERRAAERDALLSFLQEIETTAVPAPAAPVASDATPDEDAVPEQPPRELDDFAEEVDDAPAPAPARGGDSATARLLPGVTAVVRADPPPAPPMAGPGRRRVDGLDRVSDLPPAILAPRALDVAGGGVDEPSAAPAGGEHGPTQESPVDAETSSPAWTPAEVSARQADLAARMDALHTFLARHQARVHTGREPAPHADDDGKLARFPTPPPDKRVDGDARTRPAPSPIQSVYTQPSAAPVPPSAWQRVAWRGILAAVGAIALLAAIAVFAWTRGGTTSTGTLTIATDPAGATVILDGEPRGITPLTLTVPAGTHRLELTADGAHREIPLRIVAGAEVSQFVEMTRSTAARQSELSVRSEPAGARVTIDGREAGQTPLTVGDLAPGDHTIVLERAGITVTERVTLEAGRASALLVPMTTAQAAAPAGALAGWLAVDAPAEVLVYEDEQLVGSSRSERIMLPAGRHELEIANTALGFRDRRAVSIAPGGVTRLEIAWPTGTLAINAIPWAEAFVDGDAVGETPIGGIDVPIGEHEILFRHPELGERRVTVTVTAGAPAKVGVDLRSP